MAHELTTRRNGRVEMAYTGEKPWHGLGQVVTPGASIEVWQKEAGLDWDAHEAMVEYHAKPVVGVQPDSIHLHMPSRKVIYRSDTFAPVGLVSDRYNVVQPREVLESFRDLTEAGDWEIETAGTLRGGSRIWVMAKSNIEGTIRKNDKIKGRLLCATSLDGSMNTVFKLVSERVVCANTLAVAMREDGNQVSTSHRSVFNAEDCLKELGVALDAFKRFMLHAERMAETPVKIDEARNLLRHLFGQPKLADVKPDAEDYAFQRIMAGLNRTGEQKLREQRSVDRSLALYLGEGIGSNLPGSVGTQWGLLNAVTQHVDHELGRTADTRIDSAWFGRGNDIKNLAFDLLIGE